MSAEEAKKRGNEAFQKGDNEEAIKCFSEAIALDGTNAVLYSNRSAAHTAKGDYVAGLEDAEQAIKYKPEWPRAHSRKATALHFMGRLEEARDCFKRALELEPAGTATSEQLKQSLSTVEHDLAERSSRPRFRPEDMFSGDLAARLRANKSTASLVDDAQFMQLMETIKSNPKELGKHLGDQRVMSALGVLMGLPEMPQPAETPASETSETPTPMEEAPKKQETPAPVVTPNSMTQEQKEAEKEKEQGNEAYKAKKFEEALQHYNKAIELFGSEDATYRSNMSAVYLEMGNAEKCVEECEKALEDARRLRQYKLLPKLLNRQGNAHAKLNQWDQAIACYNKSLTEHRCADTLALLQNAEKKKKVYDEQSYFSPELSQKEKERGNELFKKGDNPEAVKAYTEAIKRNPKDHVLYSNRAAAYMKLCAYPSAMQDCEKCLELCPTFVKAYSRKGACHFFLKEYHKAIECYEHGLKLEPGNQECTEGLAKVETVVASKSGGSEADPEQVARAMADPEIRAILNDPVMQQVLQDLSQNPKASQHHLRNPEVMARIQKLVAAGVLRLA